MIDRAHPTLSISRQCQLLDVGRASVYRRPAPVSADDLRLMEQIDRQYLARPFYGSRRMTAWLATQGFPVNRKRVQRQGNRVKPIKSFFRIAVALWVMFARRSVLLSKSRLKN